MKLVKSPESVELAKRPRKPEESKRAKHAQRDIEAHERKQTSGHTKPLREGINGWPKRGPAGLCYYGMNNNTTLQEIKKTKSGLKKCKAHHQTKPSS